MIAAGDQRRVPGADADVQIPKLRKGSFFPELLEPRRRIDKAQRWSPEQIAGWLKRTYPDDPELPVSHETIHRTLFVQSRGAPKRGLTEHLRTRRRMRRPGGRNYRRTDGRGQLVDISHISQRPAEAEDRVLPPPVEPAAVTPIPPTPAAELPAS
jgi:IS30 family transposase